MCSPGIECKFCGANVETCERVAKALPFDGEDAPRKTGRPVVIRTATGKRKHAPVPAGIRECSIPGCHQPNAAGNTYCHAHRAAHLRAWRARQKAAK